MAVLVNELKSLFIDKAEVRRIVAEQNAKTGCVPDPTATPQKARAMGERCLRAAGLRPEDNVFSRGIIEAREEKT